MSGSLGGINTGQMQRCHVHRASASPSRPSAAVLPGEMAPPRRQSQTSSAETRDQHPDPWLRRPAVSELGVWFWFWAGTPRCLLDLQRVSCRWKTGAPPVAVERTNHSSARDLLCLPIGRPACQSESRLDNLNTQPTSGPASNLQLAPRLRHVTVRVRHFVLHA